MPGEFTRENYPFAWLKLTLNPGWAEAIIADAAGEEIPLPPDLPSRIRLLPLLRVLRNASAEQVQRASALASVFLADQPLTDDERYSRADFLLEMPATQENDRQSNWHS